MQVTTLARDSYRVWSDAKASQLSAALAYYSAFSLAPLLLISITVAGLVFGAEAVQGRLDEQLRGALGAEAADVLQSMIASSRRADGSWLATAVGLALLAFAATGLFAQLKDALNTIWGIAEKPKSAVLDFLRDRASALGMVLGIGFLLLVSLVASTALTAMSDWIGRVLPIPVAVVHVAGSAVTFALVTVLFAAIFKVLPDAEIAWRDLWLGAALTAAFFTVGKLALAWYLGRAATSSAHGAAGSFVLILLWVYYSSLILLFGASLTRVVARERGAAIRPAANAVPAPAPGAVQKDAVESEGRAAPAHGGRAARSAADGS